MFVSRCDAQERFVHLNQAWLEFARVNWRPDFDPRSVLGATWRQQISDPTTLHLYDLLTQRARNLGRPLTVAFRCDAPGLRRHMEMTVTPLPDGGLEWASRVLREEPRPPVSLLEARARRSGRLLTVCSWCKKVRVPSWVAGRGVQTGDWLEVERIMPLLADVLADVQPDLTHGACPACHQVILAEIEALQPSAAHPLRR